MSLCVGTIGWNRKKNASPPNDQRVSGLQPPQLACVGKARSQPGRRDVFLGVPFSVNIYRILYDPGGAEPRAVKYQTEKVLLVLVVILGIRSKDIDMWSD